MFQESNFFKPICVSLCFILVRSVLVAFQVNDEVQLNRLDQKHLSASSVFLISVGYRVFRNVTGSEIFLKSQ